MEYMDEAILEMRQKEKEKRHTTLETGIYVNRKLIGFQTEQLYDQQMELVLPVTFIDMPQMVADVKYPSRYRPQIIKTSLDGTVNITFNRFDIRVEGSGGLEEVAARFQAVLKQVNPAVKIFNYDEVVDEDRHYRLFSYKSYGLDAQIYNLVCVTPVGDRILQACFNCEYKDHQLWEEIAKQMFVTMKETPGQRRHLQCMGKRAMETASLSLK